MAGGSARRPPTCRGNRAAPAATPRQFQTAWRSASQPWPPAATAGSPSIRSARCQTRLSGRRADQELETVLLKDGLCRRRTQEGEIVGGFGLLGGRRRDRIDDRGVGIRREGSDDF